MDMEKEKEKVVLTDFIQFLISLVQEGFEMLSLEEIGAWYWDAKAGQLDFLSKKPFLKENEK